MSAGSIESGKIFISYSHADSAIVHQICRELTARGLSIWIDQNDGRVGDDIVEMMNRGLNESKLFIAFAGRTYFEHGRFTSAEFGAAFHKAMGANGWRIIVVKLSPEVELPPIAAGRVYILHSTPTDTAERIARAIGTAEAWDGPVYQTPPDEPTFGPRKLAVDFDGIGDRDLEIIVSAFLDARAKMLRERNGVVSFEVMLPRGRRLELTVLRAIAENETIMLSLKDLLERVVINQRFVAKFSRQIDEGLLGKFEVATEIALERYEKKLNEARVDLRREMNEIIEVARISHHAAVPVGQ
jgi:hypothetical protein